MWHVRRGGKDFTIAVSGPLVAGGAPWTVNGLDGDTLEIVSPAGGWIQPTQLAHIERERGKVKALIVSTGFVVDNTIVVLENVTRHLENGEDRITAALKGAGEVSFTVLSMSISLIAVFIPLLMMGGMVGRLFHEFAVTLSVAASMTLIVLARSFET